MSFQEHVPLLEGLSAGAGPTERSGGGAAPADAAAAGPVPAIASPVQAGPSSQIGPPAESLGPAPEAGPEPAPLPINPRPFGAGPPPMAGRGSGSPRRLLSPQEAASANRQLTPEQKLLILDTWQRSGLPALDFGALVGVSRQTLYAWKNRFEQLGPAGLDEEARKKMPTGSKLPEVTKRTILMLKKANPDWGCQRLSDVLYRGPGLPASAAAVARVLKEAGYVTEELPTTPHPDHPRSFERAAPNQLWQTDLFTFILKRQNRRVYLVGFMDDHSRFITGYGLHASQSAALVLEVFRAALTSCGSPQEVLTDNGSQYVTWRGTSAFARELQKRGIQHGRLPGSGRCPKPHRPVHRLLQLPASAPEPGWPDPRRSFLRGSLADADHAQGPGAGQRPGTGPQRQPQGSFLRGRAGRRPPLQRPCRRRAGVHGSGRSPAPGD